MRKFALVLALLGFMVQAHAVQEVEATHQAPLQRLHWCQYENGETRAQRDPCSAGQTEMSSVMVRGSSGRLEYVPLDQAKASETESDASADTVEVTDEQEFMEDFRTRMIKWLGFALAVGAVAKLLNRSFVLWFILGFILRSVLVAANLMAF